jgi:hypothetical protein
MENKLEYKRIVKNNLYGKNSTKEEIIAVISA